MKKILVISATAVNIILMAVFLVIPVFAQDSGSITPTLTPSAQPATTCPNMQQFYQNGDYQAMIEACQKISGAVNMPCFDQDENGTCPHQGSVGQTNSYGTMGGGMMNGNMMKGGMMNGGMMGNYQGGMMGNSWN